LAARIRSIAVVFALMFALGSELVAPAVAGTTGGLRGRVVDSATNAPLAGVVVTVTSPSQSASTRTGPDGGFNFLSLSPDSYVVSAELSGYDGASSAGVSVFADQVQTVGTFTLSKTIRTIGTVRARSSSALVRPGTTSDVYSVNAAGAAAAAAVGGPGGLNQAYSAIATVPGANVPQGQQGWNQLVYIRGGDYSDVSNELDGIPVQRDSDYAPITTLSSLGQQEVQTYTGGTPPSAEASGLSGYINQVIKTGSYPGYETASIGIGSPTFYHKLSFEASGATNNRNFTYYVGFGGENQDYRYSDQFNGASNPLFFYPLSVSTGLNGQVYDGSGPALFSPGQSYAIAHTSERDNIGNFHFYLPHKDGQLKDDIQLLYVTSDIQSGFYSSVNDLGGASLIGNSALGTPTYTDQYVYNGALYAPPNPNALGIALSPSSPAHVPFDGVIPVNARDADDHNASILKLQYQKNFSGSQYLRVYGYSEYTDWFLNGPVSAYLPYGGELQDYEVHGNAFGVTAQYVNQINAQNLLTVTGSYNTQKLETYSGNNYQGSITTNLVDKKGNCYSPFTGLYASCYTPLYNASGGINPSGGLNQYGFFGLPATGFPGSSLAMPATPPAGSPAAVNGATNLVTNDGQNVQIDEITPFFSAASLNDQFHPNERTTINAGIRVENYDYRLDNTVSGYPARPFWYEAYDREYSFGTSATSVGQCSEDYTGPTAGGLVTGTTYYGVNPLTGASLCAAGTNADLVNSSPHTVSFTAFQPRLSFTYTVNPDIVLRGSYGRYAAPAPTSYQQYNVLQQDSPSFLGQFLPYGFNTPFHDALPSYSNNYDFSVEQHFKGTDISYKLTPFYRSTQDQLANIPIGAQGVLDGLNVGRQRNYGVEFEIRKGDFDREGLSGTLSYTFTRSRVTYNNFGGGTNNEIDNLNQYIKNYNAYTSACAPGTTHTVACGTTSTGVAAAPCYTTGGTPDPTCAAGDIANPYYNQPLQPLLDRTGEYTPYDILPSPFQGANGYETPDVATLVLNYKHQKFAFTPSATYSSGSFYGSPLTEPGYDPVSCAADVGTSNAANTQTCSNYIFIPNQYSGKFDSFGTYREPVRLTLNTQFTYEASNNIKFTLTATGLADLCFQRGYAWDNKSTCVYAQLASNLLAPAGNFVPAAQTPIQLRYPYGSWYNNSQTGFVGQKLPFNAFLSADIRL
jgi:hypothetical protein